MSVTITYNGFSKEGIFMSAKCNLDDVQQKLVIYHKLSGESYADIARRIGTTRQTIRNWCTGHNKIPYEDVFNVYLDKLLQPYIQI